MRYGQRIPDHKQHTKEVKVRLDERLDRILDAEADRTHKKRAIILREVFAEWVAKKEAELCIKDAA